MALSQLIIKHFSDGRSLSHPWDRQRHPPEEVCTHSEMPHPVSCYHSHHQDRHSQPMLLHTEKAWLFFSPRHILNKHDNSPGSGVDFPGSFCGNKSPPWPQQKERGWTDGAPWRTEQSSSVGGQDRSQQGAKGSVTWEERLLLNWEQPLWVLVLTLLVAWHNLSLVIWMPNLKLVVIIGNWGSALLHC